MKWGFGEIDTFVGDIWELATQAFVVPVTKDLRPAGPIATGVFRRGGPSIQKELEGFDTMALGQACATYAGDLGCERLFHLSLLSSPKRPELDDLEAGLRNVLLMAYHNSMRSVAIPAMLIDPGELTTAAVARVTVETSMDHLRKAKFPGRIVIVVPSDYVLKVFTAEIDRVRLDETPS